MADHEVWDCERRFWLDGGNFYKAHVAPDAVLVFPIVGIVDRAAALAWARRAPRWTQVAFSNRIFSYAAETAVLAYEAHAEAAKTAHAYYAVLQLHLYSRARIMDARRASTKRAREYRAAAHRARRPQRVLRLLIKE